MFQGRLNHEHGPLTPARTAALGQVRDEKSTHDRFVETSKLEVLLGQPMRKVSNRVTIRVCDSRRVPVLLQIDLVRVCTWAQYAGCKPRLPGRGLHGCSSWKRRICRLPRSIFCYVYTEGIKACGWRSITTE